MRFSARIVIGAALFLGLGASPTLAHPLGNYTTNTALAVSVDDGRVDATWSVDLAEIPTLKVRQQLGYSKGAVPAAVTSDWAKTACEDGAERITIGSTHPGVLGSTARFLDGQAGLTTLRLTCELASRRPVGVSFDVTDTNFADRVGWREVTMSSNDPLFRSDVDSASPTDSLRSYPSGTSSRVTTATARFDGSSVETDGPGSRRSSGTGSRRSVDRLQSLVASRQLTPATALLALLLAIGLGGIHALAPGHGKSVMAAYVVGRRGRRRDLLTIGGVVAVTHTVGVMLLGALALATTAFSADATLRWTGALSGALIIAVGVSLARTRLTGFRARRSTSTSSARGSDHAHGHAHGHAHHGHAHHEHAHDDHGHAHDDHGHHDHGHHAHDDHAHHDHTDHDHADHAHDDHAHHDHGHHGHAHGSPRSPRHGRALVARIRTRYDWMFRWKARAAHDPRLQVTSHAHGGLTHTHVLPAPGAEVSRRQLFMMGLAGGLVPSPSALVVLIAGVTLGRAWFGVALVVAYGFGLACTLTLTGLILAVFEDRARSFLSGGTRWSARGAAVIEVVPILSSFALVVGGIIVMRRAL